MKTVVDELVTVLGLELAPGALAKLKAFGQGVATLESKLKTASVVVTGFATAAGFWLTSVQEETNQLQKLSDRTGISTDALQEWAYAARKAGVDAKTVEGDITRLQKSMQSPIPGQYNVNLAMFGVSLRKANGELKTSTELLEDFAAKFSQMSPQRASQWAGKLGISDETVTLLRKGKEGIAQLRKEAHALGAIIPSDAIKRAVIFREHVVALRTAWHTLTTQLAIAATPALEKIVDLITKWITASREWLALHFEGAAEGFSSALDEMGKFFGKVGDRLKPVIDFIKQFIPDMERAEAYTHLFIGALGVLTLIFAPLLAKFALVTGALALVGYAIEDVIGYFNGLDSVTGRVVDFIVGKFAEFNAAFPALTEAISSLYSILSKFLGLLVGDMWNALKNIGGQILSVFGTVFDVLSAVLNTAEDLLSIAGFGGDAAAQRREKRKETQKKQDRQQITQYQEQIGFGDFSQETTPLPVTTKLPSGTNNTTVNNNQKTTITQQITTPDPILTAQAVLDGINTALDVQINTPGMFAPVTR